MAPPQSQVQTQEQVKHIRYEDIIDEFTDSKPTRFTQLDKFFSQNQNPLQHTETSKCWCGCVDTVHFFSFTSLKLPALKEFLEYCFSKNYINKESQVIQDNIAKSCAHAVYGNDDIQKRLYFLSEILTPHQLITYPVKVETKTYPLFDCLFWGQYIEEDDMRKFFELFDAAGFNYVATEHSLLVQAISKYDPFSMRELYKRGCRINQECEYTMHYNIQCHLHKMQYEIEYFRGSKKAIHYFLESVITTPDLLRKFFNLALAFVKIITPATEPKILVPITSSVVVIVVPIG